MGFLDKLADWIAPSTPKAAPAPVPQFPPVPQELPRVSAKTAAEICKECKPDAGALQLLTPRQTPAQFLAILQERHMGADMVKVLAQGMPDREGVAWAVQCVLKVADKLPVADAQALQAAQAWVKDPTPERQRAAAAAAKRTDHQGPGAWAAQAAAWAQTGSASPASPEGVEMKRLTPHAVSGAVALASSVLSCPEYAARILPMLQASAIGAVGGMSLAGVSVAKLSGMSAQIQAPTLGVPGGPAVPGVSVPQLPGAAGKVQAGVAALPSMGSMAASGASLPAATKIGAAAHGVLPHSAAVGAVLGGLAALPNAAANVIAGKLPNAQMPAMSSLGLPSFSQPNIPQLPPPPVSPAVQAAAFRGQQPFIEIGLGIASGKMPLA